MARNESNTRTADQQYRVSEYVPGIGLLAICAVGSWLVAAVVPVLNQLLVAIFTGVLLANLGGIPAWASKGVASHKVPLGAAIVLMGATLSIDAITRNGPLILVFVAGAIAFTMVFVEIISRNLFGIDTELSSLLAAGSGICGVSAVVAVAGSIRAREEHVVYATATVLLFDALTLVVYPAVGRLLAIPARTFGVWAGISMFSTGPVIAVGFMHSEAAGQWATLTKLTRNVFIGVVALGYATYYVRARFDASSGESDSEVRLQNLWVRFPKFVVGFVALTLLASSGALSRNQIQAIEHAYNWLFLFAFVGLGTELSVTEFRRVGPNPVLIVFTTLCTVSVLSLVILSIALG